MSRTAAIAFFAISLAGCANVSNPMDGFTGAFVTVRDTGHQSDSNKGEFFSMVEVDGKPIKNSIAESRSATAGRGNVLISVYVRRSLPVRTMEVKLVGTHQTAMPMHEIASRAAGTFFEVSGVVRFEPKDGSAYEVTGSLVKDKSCVWISDTDTQQPATAKVCNGKAQF